MSDPKERFIAGLGPAAKAVSGNTPRLVERLRKQCQLNGAACRDGADEIERLASQLSDLEAAKNDALTLANLREERLRRGYGTFAKLVGWLRTRAESAEAEVAKLKEALTQARGALLLAMSASQNMTRTYNDAIERAEAACQAALAQSPEPK